MKVGQEGRRPAMMRWTLAAVLAAAVAWAAPGVLAGGVQEGPEWVLNGTDLVSLDEVPTADLPEPLEGRYGVEQGGAMLKLSIEAISAQQWTVRRTYEEPGLSVQIKTNTVERRGSGLTSSDASMTLRGSDAGLLVHEQDSGLDTIPPDYWILYYRED